PAELVEHLLAEDSPALDGALPDVWRVNRCDEQVELHDGNARRNDLVETAGHGLGGNGGRDPLDARRDEVVDELELLVRLAAFRPGDLELDVEVLGGSLGAVDDLLDERVAD